VSVSRLKLGQRVYVVSDEAGAPVGAWGNVARECFRRALAWVRLDARHERCPFPADNECRATWILTVPEHCSSVEPAPAPVTGCRRCLECAGQAHHWITSMPECPEGGEPFIACKHCDARASLCDDCGEGPVWPSSNGGLCEECQLEFSERF